MENRLRFDLFIAVCALLLSGIAAGAAAYQTFVINQQFSATVWPYLASSETYDPGRLRLEVENDGLGPAIVKSADITINTTVVTSWLGLVFRAPHRQHGTVGGHFSSLEPGDVIRSGQDKLLLDLRGTPPFPQGIAQWERDKHVTLNVCYCSILQRCWLVHFLGDDSTPHDVKSCDAHHHITYQAG